MAKFDAVVANIRRELTYPFEGLQVPPGRWKDEAYLFGTEKLLVVFAGTDEELLSNFPYPQVALRDFVVAGQDADFPFNETERQIFANSVRMAEDAFESRYQGGEWHPQVARLIIELKLASPVADNDAMRKTLLSPLRDVLEGTLILPPLPEPIDLESVGTVHSEFDLEMSLFVAAELQLAQPLQEQEAVRRIRACLPQCPANLVGNKKVRLAGANPIQHWISFRVRQF